MPKLPTFGRNLLSGNFVSFRLMKGKKFKDLLITERVDYYCEKSIISVSTTFSTKSLHQNMYYTLLFKINPRQGNRFFKINVNKYDNLLEFCTQQNSALLQMLIFLPILGNFARSKQQPWSCLLRIWRLSHQVWHQAPTKPLCSRNFQNVKLTQHGEEILQFACHSDFT